MTPEERNQRIHGTLEMLMQDYRGGRTIDEIKTFFHPDKEAVIEVLNKLQRIIRASSTGIGDVLFLAYINGHVFIFRV